MRFKRSGRCWLSRDVRANSDVPAERLMAALTVDTLKQGVPCKMLRMQESGARRETRNRTRLCRREGAAKRIAGVLSGGG